MIVGAVHRLVGADAGLEHVLPQLVHLLRADGAPLPRPDVALGPRHGEAAPAEEIDPPDKDDDLPVSETAEPRADRGREALLLPGFADVISRHEVGSDAGVGQELLRDLRELLHLPAIVTLARSARRKAAIRDGVTILQSCPVVAPYRAPVELLRVGGRGLCRCVVRAAGPVCRRRRGAANLRRLDATMAMRAGSA